MALGLRLGLGQVGTFLRHLGTVGEVFSDQASGPHSHPGPRSSLLGSGPQPGPGILRGGEGRVAAGGSEIFTSCLTLDKTPLSLSFLICHVGRKQQQPLVKLVRTPRKDAGHKPASREGSVTGTPSYGAHIPVTE